MPNKKTKNNVLVLGITSFFNDISSEMLVPLIPLFLANVLGAPGIVIGLIEGAAKAGEQLFAVFVGWYSDKVGKRKFLVALGYLIPTIAKGLFAFAFSWPMFFLFRFIERTGKAVRTPPRDALLAESVETSKRRRGFAVHRIFDQLGGMLGPLVTITLLAYIFLDFEQAARSIFLFSVIPGALAIIILWTFVKESKEDIDRVKKKFTNMKFWDTFKINGYGTEFVSLLKTFGVFYLVWPALAFFYLKAQDVGIQVSEILLIAFVYSVFYVIGAGFLSYISKWKKIKNRGAITLGILGMAFVFFLMSIATSAAQFIPAFALYGFLFGMTEVEIKSYTSVIVDKKRLASAYGVYQTTTGIAALFGGLIIGTLWDFNPSYAFQVSGVIALAALGMFIRR